MKKEISFALVTILIFELLFFAKGFIDAFLSDLLGQSGPHLIISNALRLIFPLLAIFLASKWQKVHLMEVSAKKYLLYVLGFLYAVFLIEMLFTGLPVVLSNIPVEMANDPVRINGFITGAITYHFIKPLFGFLFFVISFFVLKKFLKNRPQTSLN